MCFGWKSWVEKSVQNTHTHTQALKLKYTVHVGRKNKSGTSNSRGDWNHLKVIHKIPEQRTGKQEIKEL
jgi:hypothetical protein